ncbi:MAG: oxidoreductase [Roseateles depolymerans]|uniref:Oxidoreductase n=1 Tax=Roseateles depolymerans TaxID=76731 RepID=A0A2W5DF00_9BURK|nr:MAG: oxidoreductase [Roseateles depolymerans]
MMMGYGQFVFSLSTLAYQDLQRQTAWRHPSNSRVGARPARQFVGPGDDGITLSGVLAPEFAGDVVSLGKLREMGDSGLAWPLVTGTGEVLGAFVIESLNETRTMLMDNGAARRIEFQLQLARVDEQRTDSIGTDSP